MKKLSDEELVMGIECIVRISTARKAELLSRLSKGQKAIEAMEKIISARQAYITHNINTDVYVGRIKDILADYEQTNRPNPATYEVSDDCGVAVIGKKRIVK
jgi:hypothetical protein